MEHSSVLFQNEKEIFFSDEHWLYPLFEVEQFFKERSIQVNELFLRDKIATLLDLIHYDILQLNGSR
jgi:hypothetical protein